MNIDRCICTGLTFAQVLERARSAGWDLDAVRRELGAGAQCGLCRPYLRHTLATGQTTFDRILTDDARQG
jgi:bacterioferritin-associated ferredoxin